MTVKVINAILPLLLAAGAVACLATGRTEAGMALLTAVGAHLLPSPIPPKDGES
jgi:hypothetical protein